jgi:nucleotide-binding universal stress UspA family protein
MAIGDKVLVATDLSEPADEAIRQAHVFAEEASGELIACHAVHELLRYSPLFPQRAQSDLNALVEIEGKAAVAVEERVVAVTGRAPGSFTVHIMSGAADAEVLREAEEVSATLIATGSRGLTGIARLLLGNIAERIVRYAHCPVLVARKHAQTGKILVATDLSEKAEPAVKLAAEIAAKRKATLVLVHSLDLLPRPVFGAAVPFGGLPVIPPPELVTEARKVADEVLASLLVRFGVQGERRVLDGDAATAILQVSDEIGADLVVVATHGRTGLARVALGSVAEKVVRGAHCSVLVVRSH